MDGQDGDRRVQSGIIIRVQVQLCHVCPCAHVPIATLNVSVSSGGGRFHLTFIDRSPRVLDFTTTTMSMSTTERLPND